MSIQNPSQYECDNAQQGDMVAIRGRSFLYKWYRKHFLKDKVILHVRKDWNSDERVDAYQEDCTLIYKWELIGTSEFKNEVPYFVGIDNNYILKRRVLKSMRFGSENTCLTLKSGVQILVPTSYIRDGIQKMDCARTQVDEERQIHTALQYARYNGEYFRKKYKELDLKEWNLMYCHNCGKPITLTFGNETSHLENTCKCGGLQIKSEDISWDMVAYWFNSRISKPVIEAYKQFWKI